MATTSCILSLPQMIDLAVSSPEVGSVNFNILHTVLHVVVQQLDLLKTKVEFRGDDGNRVQSLIAVSRPGPTLNVSEYQITDENTKQQVGTATTDKKEGTKVVLVESIKESKEAPSFSIAIDKKKFEGLEHDIKKLKNELNELKEMPANSEIIDAIRNKEGSPVCDMLQLLTLSKRIDGVETGLAKMGSMLEDIAKEDSHRGSRPRRSSHVGNQSAHVGGSTRPSKSRNTDKELGTTAGTGTTAVGTETDPRTGTASASAEYEIDEFSEAYIRDAEAMDELNDRMALIEKQVQKLGVRIEEITDYFTSELSVSVNQPVDQQPKGNAQSVRAAGIQTTIAVAESGSTTEKQPTTDGLESSSQTGTTKPTNKKVQAAAVQRPSATQVQTPPSSVGPSGKHAATDTAGLSDQMKHLGEKVDAIMQSMFGTSEVTDTDTLIGDNKFAELEENFKSFQNFFANESRVVNDRLNRLEKEIEDLMERAHVINVGGGTNDQGSSELYAKLLHLQDEFNNLTKTLNKLNEDKQHKQLVLETITEQLELIKTIKANREDLEEALADKADTCAINRKVSHDQFDAACGDINRGIETMMSKLRVKEDVWEQTMNDIQREIGSKLDKMDLDPLRDFVSKKIRLLQEKLKALSALKKETEAAGTKSKFLRNVNCISCDKDVVMRRDIDPSLMPVAASLPPTKSMGPYLAYELDALRKQQKCAANGRNMNHFENALGSKITKKDHLCNRYCGGSHTLTTPQQRVTRLGHFIQQYGPQAESLQEGHIKGKDGQMYKARDNASRDEDDFVVNVTQKTDLIIRATTPARRSTRSGSQKDLDIRLTTKPEKEIKPIPPEVK